MDDFRVIAHIGDDSACLHPIGELDIASREMLDRAQRRVFDAYPVTDVMVDLEDVRLIDGSGLGVLVKGRNHAHSRGIRYWVANAHGMVGRVFEITGLTPALCTP